ncbi:MAG: molecular chaperone DnaJ [Pseudomonadales bacterium]|nr:molecular chaperone DnaJ [Pseudomonadales bacterium]
MIRAALIAVLAIFFGALIRLAWLRARGNPGAFILATAIGTAVAVVLLAVATGRLHWLFTIPAAILPLAVRFARFLPVLRILARLGVLGGGGASAAGAPSGRRSEVRTRSLRMVLDHESGSMDGDVLTGPHAGRRLGELDETALIEWLRTLRAEDPDAARLLESYLDRTYGGVWRTRDEGAAQGGGRAFEGEPDRAQALAILGLDGDPDRDTIVRAHRRLMQQFHPDQGGTDFLAALLNGAKARLIDDLDR